VQGVRQLRGGPVCTPACVVRGLKNLPRLLAYYRYRNYVFWRGGRVDLTTEKYPKVKGIFDTVIGIHILVDLS